MATRAGTKVRSGRGRAHDESAVDREVEQFLSEHHDAVEAKLQKARQSIARGLAKPIEPLSTLLRQARRRRKAAR